MPREAQVAAGREARARERPDDRVPSSRVVEQRRLLFGIVLTHDAEEHGTRDLILDLQAGNLADPDGRAVRLPIVLEVLVLAVDAQLVDGTPTHVRRDRDDPR